MKMTEYQLGKVCAYCFVTFKLEEGDSLEVKRIVNDPEKCEKRATHPPDLRMLAAA